MNESGNHGGNDPGETESALVFASPKLRTMPAKKTYECPAMPANGTRFDYYNKVDQQDLVPTLSTLLGLTIPRNSIGTILSEMRGLWPTDESYARILAQNAQQLSHIADTVFGPTDFHARDSIWPTLSRRHIPSLLPCKADSDTVEQLACLMGTAEQQALYSSNTGQWNDTIAAYEVFIRRAQQALIKESRSFDTTSMATGIALCALAMVACWYSIGTSWPSRANSLSCVGVVTAYGLALFASTSERSERYFWHLATLLWLVFLVVKATDRIVEAHVRSRIVRASIRILISHGIVVSWTTLGSSLEEMLSEGHTSLIWSTIFVSHFWNGFTLIGRTFTGLMARPTATSITILLASTASIFKISHELEQAYDVASPFGIDQITLFRTCIGMIALVAMGVCILVAGRGSRTGIYASLAVPALPERLHHLLTLFLMVQSRSVNLPVFFLLDCQRSDLQMVLQYATLSIPHLAHEPSGQRKKRNNTTSAVYVAVSVLTFSHSYFFCLGGSNSISTIDLSNAYNGVSKYNIITVAVLLFSANWTGPIWWCSAACSMVPWSATHLVGFSSVYKTQASSSRTRDCVLTRHTEDRHMQTDHRQPWLSYLSTLSALMAAIVLVVMVLCTIQREHVTVWTLWGSKYLYSMFWVLEWYLVVSVGFSSILRVSQVLG
jgi:ethanolaminephosphotransferase